MTRIYTLAANHPLVSDETQHCAKCHERFQGSDRIVLIPVERPAEGWATVEALAAHVACVQITPD